MKILQFIGLLLFVTSCGDHSSESPTGFKRILPDTSKSWSGEMTRDAFRETRELERKLNIRSLVNGIQGEEIRMWALSGSYDPQRLTILSRAEGGSWHVRKVSFHRYKNDSISSDVTKPVGNFSLDSYWNLASQSDLANGDDYGCLDGGHDFIEMADAEKYRFMWYTCPDINEKKDSAFHKVIELQERIASLTRKR